MRKRLSENMINIYIPCIGFSVAAGVISAIIITLFKLCAEGLILLSSTLYNAVRTNPQWLPVLILGAAAIGFAASFLYFLSSSCRGGGIPSSVAAIRGIYNFRWLRCIIILPFSALMSLFCGLPLGTEGPCVQLGTAVGDGVVSCLASNKNKGWKRYIMTGGAAAGFSIAASSPFTAIIFAMEELHKHFSPLIMMVASISVMTAQTTVHMLASLGIGSLGLFHIPEMPALDFKLLFVPLIIGIICGVGSLLFTNLYQHINTVIHSLLKKASVKIVFPVLFALVALIGFFISDSLGTGHSLIESLFSSQMIWYFILLLFLIRAIVMMMSNTAGVTGGVFLPTLSFGALLGAFCGEIMISLGWLGSEHYILMVALGIVAFLGATSHVPVTACIFAIEALSGYNNVLPIIIAVTVSFLIVDLFGAEDFTDSVIESKMRSLRKGKTPTIVDVPLTVKENAFVIGKQLRDILWPNACVVVSIERAPEHRGKHEVLEGDIITVHYKTYDTAMTAEEIKTLMGEQSAEVEKIMNPA